MRLLHDIPIRRKLTIITMLTSCVALVLASAAFVTYELVTFREAMVNDLSSMAKMVGDSSAAALSFNDPASAEQTLKSLSADPHIVAGAVYDKDGKLFAKYQRAALRSTFTLPPLPGTGHRFTEQALEMVQPISLAGEGAGAVYLVSDLEAMRERLWRYGTIVLAVMMAASLVAFVISARLQRVISEPISHVAAVASAVANDRNYSVRALKQGEDELGRLVEGFNEMLAQIETQDAQLRKSQELLEKRVEERTAQLQQEVADHQRSAKALHETNQRFEIVTRATTDVIWDWNLVSNTLWWNENLLTVYGYAPAEVGSSLEAWSEKIHPDDLSAILDSIHQIIAGGGHLWSAEYRFRRRDGTYAIVFDRGYVMHDEAGRAVRMIGAMQDFTKRRQAEDALREGEARIRTIVDTALDAVITMDDQGVIVDWNPQAEEMFGWSRAEAVGRKLSATIIPLDQRETTDKGLHRWMETGQGPVLNKRIEVTVLHREGRQVEIELAVTAIKTGANVAYSAFIRDITERKRAEAELERAHRQLLDVSRQAGMAEVATGVLHNVGNVLNSVNVSATLLTDTLKKSKLTNLGKAVALMRQHQANLGAFLTDDPKGRQLFGYLEQLTEHMTAQQNIVFTELEELRKYIEHIKDIVSMQQSYAKVSGVAEIVNATELVEDSLRMNAAALARHDIKLVREFEEIPPITVEKHKVLQLLVNLIRNAKSACDESGAAEKRVTIRVSRQPQGIRISVTDNGVGIPPENLTRIFAHGFTTKKTGHGFGLHSGALAAKEMGGSLQAFSEGIGRGATFTLDLPLESLKRAA